MAKTLEGKYYINGKDAYLEYGLVFEKGAFDSLLMFPETKPGYSEEYEDQSGTDYMAYPDTVVNSLSIDVPFLLLASNRADFMNKYNKIRDLFLPGKYFIIEVPTLSMAFTLRYSKMTSFKKVTQLKELEKVGAKLTMTLIDDKPDSRSIFKSAMDAAKAAGYSVDEAMFQAAVSADLPYRYMKEAEIILAPGIKKTSRVAGVDKFGRLVEFTAYRAGSATYIGKDGLLKIAVTNEPRIDYSTGAPMYLVEGAASNLNKFSYDLTQYSGSLIPSIIDDGTKFLDDTPAYKVSNNTGAEASIFSWITVAAGTGNYTGSVYVKRDSALSIKLSISLNGVSPNPSITYDFTTQAFINPSNGVIGYSAVVLGDWVRLSITGNDPTGTTLQIAFQVFIKNGESAYLSGFQTEASSASTSYIPTNGAIATRAMDSFSIVRNLYPYLSFSVFANIMSNGGQAPIFAASGCALQMNAATQTVISNGDSNLSTVVTSNRKTLMVFGSGKKNIYNGGAVASTESPYTGGWGASAYTAFNTGSQSYWTNFSVFAVFSRKFTDQESIALTK